MKKLLLVLLSTATVTSFADCLVPSTPQESIKCMADSFNARKDAVTAKSSEIYQYNYNTGYGALTNHVSSLQRVAAAPYYAAQYQSTVAKDVKNLVTLLKNKQFSQLPASFAQYQKDRRALFTGKAANFATYTTKELEQLIGKLENISGNQAKAHAYAEFNYVGYLIPATVYELYDFASTDGYKYLNSSVNTFSQSQCEAEVSGFQNQFKQLAAKNGTVKMIASQAAPGSLTRDVAHLTMKEYSPYIFGALDIMYAVSEGKAVRGSTSVPYNICDYNVFKSAVATGTNPDIMALNSIVEKTAAKTGFAPQNIYWIYASFTSAGLAEAISRASINAGAGALVK